MTLVAWRRPVFELAEDRAPWERQPPEPDTEYEAFLVYRNMGPRRRSVHAVRQQGHVVAEGHLATANRWAVRAQAWDSHIMALEDERLAETRAQTVREHLAEAREHRKVAVAREGDAGDVRDRAQAFAEAVRIERLSLGMPTQISRKEADLKRGVEHAVMAQGILMQIIQEQVCEDCRERVAGALGQAREARQKALELLGG